MSQHAPEKIWSGIEVSKVIAGTLAAITAAVVGSFLGVAGTLAGAAVASVVGSVGTEIYQRSLNRGAKRLGQIAPTFVKAPAAVGTPPVAAATEEESPSHIVTPRKNIRWGRVAVAASALFVLAMGSLTAFELLTGESMASTIGNSSSAGTTVGSIIGDGSEATQAPAPAPSQTPESTPATDGPESPAGEPSTAPTSDPATEPTPDSTTEPTTDPTTEPTGEAPQQTPPADTQNQEQTQNEQGKNPDQGDPTE